MKVSGPTGQVQQWFIQKADVYVEPCLPYMWKRPFKPLGIFFSAFLLSLSFERLTRSKESEPSSWFNVACKTAATVSILLSIHAAASLAPQAKKFIVARFR